jgi:hypothetical protein
MVSIKGGGGKGTSGRQFGLYPEASYRRGTDEGLLVYIRTGIVYTLSHGAIISRAAPSDSISKTQGYWCVTTHPGLRRRLRK